MPRGLDLKRLTALLLLLCAYLTAVQTTWAAVGLFNFQAASVTTGINLSWQTGFEDNNLGFNLFRAEINDRNQAVQINAALIPSQSQGGGGASYDYLDSPVTAGILYYYWVETVGDSLAEPVPPASATWNAGGGLVTNTPAPTASPTPTATASATATVTSTPDPSASATATANASPTTVATATATRPATATPLTADNTQSAATETPVPANAVIVTNTAVAIIANEPEAATEIAATVTSVGPAAAQASPTPEPIQAIAENQVLGQPTADLGAAAAIGANTGTTLTGTVVEREGEGLSTGILMLLIAGGVFLFGGGATAFILLRQGQQK